MTSWRQATLDFWPDEQALELAWAAGFYDGEGGCYVRKVRSYRALQLAVAQSDMQPLVRFQAAIGGFGWIIPLGPCRWAKRPRYKWYMYGRARIEAVTDMLWPYLCSAKRAQIISAFIEVGPQRPRATKDEMERRRALSTIAKGNSE